MTPPRLTAADEREVRRILRAALPALAAVAPEFPAGCCVLATRTLAPLLEEAFGHHGDDRPGVYWGPFRTVLGRFDDEDHQWVESEDGVIIDATVRQFQARAPIVIRPGAPLYDRYQPFEYTDTGTRHPRRRA